MRIPLCILHAQTLPAPRYRISSRSTTPNRACTVVAAQVDERADVGRGRAAVVHDEVRVRGRDARAADRAPLQPGAVDQRAGRRRDARRARASTAGSGFWKMQPALGVSSGCVRLRCASERAGGLAQRRGVGARLAARSSADSRTSPVSLQAAAVVRELHLGRRHVRDARRRRPSRRTDSTSSPIDRAAVVRVAEDRAADGARRAGPRLEARRGPGRSSTGPGR